VIVGEFGETYLRLFVSVEGKCDFFVTPKTHRKETIMSINLHCPVCRTGSSMQSKQCKSCGFEFKKRRKYRVIVRGHDGRRVSKVVDSISMAK